MKGSKSVIVVEDEFLIRLYLERLCKEIGVTVLGSAADEQEAEDVILQERPDYVLMDVRLKHQGDGVRVSKRVRSQLPNTRVIFITGSSDPDTTTHIETDHPFRILMKPIAPDQLRAAFEAE